jgi:hypothetical protein
VWLRVFSDPGLRAEFADVLDRVERLVLLAPVDVTQERAHPTFKAIVELPG